MSPSEITAVGKYRVLSQIGEGAMGVVYRALDPVLNRPVAIKVMSDAVARDESLRERFLREAQAAGSLQHPNLITIYDYGEVDGHLYIAMEFVEGEDLDHLMAKRVPLSLTQKIDILVEVLTGLSYAHKRGIVHRDIKPANIRIDDEGRARIMDFGIAHINSSNMTRTGVMVGTPAYMAPEQIVGGPVSPATDIFSVGAVMYELLTNAKPFDGETLQTIMYKIVSHSPPDISTLLPGLPGSLNVIVQRALAKEPSARFSNAIEMANALTTARGTLPDSSPGVPPLSLRSSIEHALAGEHAKAKRRKRRRTLTLSGVAAGVIVVGSVAAWMLTRPRTQQTALQ
jgi:serine/threonine-protein kinase